jgi:murein DD-endopeptidase MepM/ murein hydrolase activator NlpD
MIRIILLLTLSLASNFTYSIVPCSEGYIRPISKGWISSKFGIRSDPFTHKRSQHNGIDFATKATYKAYAANNGVVTFSGEAGDHGNRVELTHENGDVTAYSHMGTILVELEHYVERGRPIGIIGPTTGRSTGPHLGFELIKDGKNIDPQPHIFRKGECTPAYYEE